MQNYIFLTWEFAKNQIILSFCVIFFVDVHDAQDPDAKRIDAIGCLCHRCAGFLGFCKNWEFRLGQGFSVIYWAGAGGFKKKLYFYSPKLK